MKLPKIVYDRTLQNEGEVMVSTEGGPVFPSWAEAREIAHRCNVHDELLSELQVLLDWFGEYANDESGRLSDREIRINRRKVARARAVLAKAKGE